MNDLDLDSDCDLDVDQFEPLNGPKDKKQIQKENQTRIRIMSIIERQIKKMRIGPGQKKNKT